ncbi:hypothetical protein EV363DRAFT_1169043 [Boletus edulis]|nr:hypothetical protein EV363DRAFT_1169043 [Boletus edulis]
MTASFLPPETEEITQFRTYSGLFSDPLSPPPPKPVVFIICRHNHYFTVCFDYQTNHAWTFGQDPNPTTAGLHTNVGWDGWNGLMYWRRVSALFGWPISDVNPRVDVYDFKQNGLDCGPIAISITQYLLQNGPDAYLRSIPGTQSPYLECPHLTRRLLLECVSRTLFDCHRWWRALKETESWLEEPSDIVLDLIRNGGLEESNQVTSLNVMLARSRDRCQECKPHRKHRGDLDGSGDSGDSDGSDGSGGSGGSSHQENSTMLRLPSYLKRLKIMRNARNRAILRPRVPRIKSQAMPLPAQRYLPFPIDNSFDDYLDGPTLEDLQDAIRENAEGNMRSNWDYFRDYGYRLLADFAVTFNQQDPINVEEHILPVGEPEFQDPSSRDETVVHHLSTDRMGEPCQVHVEDVDVMGMADMLKIAGNRNSSRSIDLFVRGINPVQGNYVCFRPERDAVPITTGEIRTTLDIDSVIWVTNHLHVCGSLKVNVMPYFGNKPPIPKNNHCEVEILWPQSATDQERGGRSEWFTKSVPISNVPHIHFAQAGDGSGSVNFYVAFPRMMHKNPKTGRSATLIPSPVQIVWLTQVLLPAIKATAPQEIREYSDFSYEEWKWKATVNNQLRSSRTLTLDPTTIENLVHRMRLIISQSHDGYLAPFGSFFFIADIRGIKLNTVTVRGRSIDPLVTLYQEIPTLDWEYMMCRENGQLLLDLGISYHPDPVDQQPLIGLWKLNSIHASYAKAGMNKPTEFKTCTMPRHGGLQATMESVRRKAVQLTFRSTYNLIFEAFRRPGQEEKFCADPEAFANTAVFQQTCHEFLSIYHGAKTKSFGVREEVRGSGFAIIEALRSVWHKVCFRPSEYLDSDPVLWVSSQAYCEFMIRRLEELRFIQVRFFKEPSSNYAIVTCIIVHLLRNMSFSIPAKDIHLIEALKDLSYEGVIQRFGMFFLQDLNLVTGELPVILEIDDADVALKLRSRVKKVTKSRNPAGTRSAQRNTEATAEYPLGEWPTWNELVQCLDKYPTDIMKSWRWTSDRTWDECASDLFVAFTNAMWLALEPSRLQNPLTPATTLQEAIQSWSVSHVFENLLSVRFLPNSHGLNKNTKQSWDFTALLDVFFPQAHTLLPNMVWTRFTERNGYLRMYSDYQKNLSAEDFETLNTLLALLLNQAQCLPNSIKATNSSRGRVWNGFHGTIDMRTNSTCYKLKGIGSVKSTRRTVMRINLPSHQVVTRIDEAEGICAKASKNRRRRENRSARSKNKRFPPK